MKKYALCFGLFLFFCSFHGVAEIQTVGALLVDLDARNSSAATDEWVNNGSLGNFSKLGNPQVKEINNRSAVVFDGVDDAWIGPVSVAGIEGNSTCSIEVWVYNPDIGEEEAMVAWGRRERDRQNMSFNYGSSRDFGAVTHWRRDLGWKNPPEAGMWHYLVYTHDGRTERVYYNTMEKNSQRNRLETVPGNTINIAVQNGGDGTPQFRNEYTRTPLAGSLALAAVRIHDGVLTPDQIRNNFKHDAERFNAKIPEHPLADKPVTLSGDDLVLNLVPMYHTVWSLSSTNGNFDFTPGDRLSDRIESGYYHLGDVTLKWREGDGEWQSFTSAKRRQEIKKAAEKKDRVLSNLTPLMGTNSPLMLMREWSVKNGQPVLRFHLKNTGTNTVELGAFGAPMVFNNLLSGRRLDESHTKCVFIEPYMGGDAGYLQVTRLNGHGPVLLVIPEKGTQFENYRPLLDDPTRRGVAFEGFYEWMVHSKAYADNEWKNAQQLNVPTSRMLQPGETGTFGFVFVTAPTINDINKTLRKMKHPVAVGIPGYVLPMEEYGTLFLSSPSPVSNIYVSPPKTVTVKKAGFNRKDPWQRYFFYPAEPGRCRLEIMYENGLKQYVHCIVVPSQREQVRRMAAFHDARQWYTDTNDPFGRTYSYMSYDREKNGMVLDERRSYISGLSDEPGAGPNLAMAIKNLMDPDPAQVARLEQYVDETLWGKLQYTNNYGIRASLFYGTDWNKRRTETTWRAYNYPHQASVYWSLYRLARNYSGLVKNHSWEWYLRQAYKTGLAMKEHCGKDDFLSLSQFGLMVGSVFPEILNDLQREGWTAEAQEYESFMKSRADIWNSLEYPFGSEMPWDSTGQEEVYLWCRHFGLDDKAQVTLDAVKAYMPSMPSWGYHGNGRRYFDSMVYGKWRMIARESHHYGSSLNAIPLLNAYRRNPTDFHQLHAGYGGTMGILANIDSNGFGAMCFMADPAHMAPEPYSSDFGCAFYGYAYNAGSYVVIHPEFGRLGFGCYVWRMENTIHITPHDAFRRRIYLQPYKLWLTLDSGSFKQVDINLEKRNFELILEPANQFTPDARLRIEQYDGKAETKIKPKGKYEQERGAWVIPLSEKETRVTLR